MDWTHETFVAVSKSWGLFYLVGLSIAVLIYALVGLLTPVLLMVIIQAPAAVAYRSLRKAPA